MDYQRGLAVLAAAVAALVAGCATKPTGEPMPESFAHKLIAEKALDLAVAAIEQQLYEPGIHAIARVFKQRIHQA